MNEHDVTVNASARVDIEVCGAQGQVLYTIVCYPGDQFAVWTDDSEAMGTSIGADHIDALIVALREAKSVLADGVRTVSVAATAAD